MKNKIVQFLIAAAVCLAMASCIGPSPLTAPKDPETGIRMDIPRDPANGEKLWQDFDPLNHPGTPYGPGGEPPLTSWQSRNALFFGHP